MEAMAVREFERIQCGDAFDSAGRTVTQRQHAALERFNEGYRKRNKVTVFSHGPKRSLVAQNFVGIINLGRNQIEVLPKIEGGTTEVRRSLARMISTALELELHGDSITRTDVHSDSVLEVLIRLFCEQLWQAVRRGMVRRYVAKAENVSVLRGKLEVSRQARLNAARPDRLFCSFDEFTDDNLLNRVLKAALKVLHRVSRSPSNLRNVAELLFCFQDVGDIEKSTIEWDRVTTDRLSARYEPLTRLARLFIEGESPDVVTGANEGFALLFDMNELFEAFVGSVAKQVFGRAGLKVNLQGPRRHLAQHMDGADAFALRPDVVVSRGSEVLAVVDTKWKRLKLAATREGVSSGDAYQMHAYATQYGAPEVMLLYPHHSELGHWKARRAEYSFRELGVAPATGARKVCVGTVDLSDIDGVATQLRSMLPSLEHGSDTSRG
jgi:5-methylcytosine-specific restriction enzyme subunit McrC